MTSAKDVDTRCKGRLIIFCLKALSGYLPVVLLHFCCNPLLSRYDSL
jgi:hypothetical protein